MLLKELSQLQKILANETRLRIVFLLSQRELTVTDICAVLDLNQSAVSKHLIKLRLLGVVHDVREGSFIYYSLNDDNEEYMKLIRFLVTEFSQIETFQEDLANLNRISPGQ